MSTFLGPVHAKMYGRVLFQDAMAQALLEVAEQKGWASGIRELADSKAPAASNEPLEELIDQSNIHGWLSEAVVSSERRFALIVSGILAGHPERLEELKSTMTNLGRQSGRTTQPDAERTFQDIHDILLDGMPCDFPFNVTESGTDAVVWQVISCPHTPYWQAEECGAETYYLLRDAWIEGALEGSGITHTRASGEHALRKKR